MRIADRMSPAVRRIILVLAALSVLVALTVVGAVQFRSTHRDAGIDSRVGPSGSPSASGSAQPSAAASAADRLGTAPSRGPSPSKGPAGPGNGPAEFPNAGNTGVPAGVALKQFKGALIISKPGTVIDAMNIVGKVVVNADNVTIKRSRITAPTDLPNQGRDEFTVVQQATSAHGLVLEDCEIDGSNLVYRAIMASDRLTVNRCELKNVGHGAEVVDNYTIENSWIHDTNGGPDNDWHIDGVISSAGVNGVIRHNTIVLIGTSLTGAVGIGSALGPIDNVLIQDNLLAGGNYTVYVQDQGKPATRIQVLDNRFSTMVEPKVGVFGIWYPNDLPKDLVRHGNKIYETGAAADE